VSEHSLPEDLSRWPQSPYAILGVTQNCTPRDLKRNYTRLIKTYKPEHHPEHFRRIREAYEYVLRIAEMLSDPGTMVIRVPGSSGERPMSDEETIAQATDNAGRSPVTGSPDSAAWSGRAPSPDIVADREIATFWELAVAGDEAQAYRGLVQMVSDGRAGPNVFVRLYWLLSLNDELDETRDAREWLVDAICVARGIGPAFELYRREIAAFPAEALSKRFDRVIELATSTEQFAELLSWRIEGRRQLGQWDELQADFEQARDRLRGPDDVSWLYYLLAVAMRLAWSEDFRTNGLWESCLSEFHAIEHLATRYRQEFDRLDHLTAVRSGIMFLRDGAGVPRQLRHLLVCGALRPFEEAEDQLQQILADIDSQPRMWLDFFDRACEMAGAVVAQFGVLLQNLSYRKEAIFQPPNDETLVSIIVRFLQGVAKADYWTIRHKLVEFCHDEAIAPEWIADAVARGIVPGLEPTHQFAQMVGGDWPLHFVCWARRLVWA
jgi:hypothetical protein